MVRLPNLHSDSIVAIVISPDNGNIVTAAGQVCIGSLGVSIFNIVIELDMLYISSQYSCGVSTVFIWRPSSSAAYRMIQSQPCVYSLRSVLVH